MFIYLLFSDCDFQCVVVIVIVGIAAGTSSLFLPFIVIICILLTKYTMKLFGTKKTVKTYSSTVREGEKY